MGVKWTEEQQRVIDTYGCSVLVSAAAGSGKTAVLVARILAMVTNPEHPVDIDRMLVVTFTNAAAAEMRQRIRDALELRAEEEPENEHLQRQLVLIHNAKITTIHSFCLQVLRNHFHLIGLDPAFRVADEAEMQLMRKDVLKEVLEEAYEREAENPKFHEFVDQFSPGKNDKPIEDAVLALYHYSMGQPWPLQWLAECRGIYETGREALQTAEDVHQEDPLWLQAAVEDAKQVIEESVLVLEQALRVTEDANGPYLYADAILDDMEQIRGLQKAQTYQELAQAFLAMHPYKRLSVKKDPTVSEEKKQLVKDLRESVKTSLAGVRTRYFYDSLDTICEEFCRSGEIVQFLTEFAELFIDRLSKRKAEKNILDFSDLEHLALQILVEQDETGAVHPTAAAGEYAEQFEEIMIDEYQDSNLVQEMLLGSVKGHGCGANNLFMVGDVKQSIYRFRLARPELFLEKYHTYPEMGDQACRIDLHRNFRSRAEVLCSINYVFRQIMTENPGGVVYDKEAALYPGAVFPDKESASPDPEANGRERSPMGFFGDNTTEIWLEEAQTGEKQEAEARMAAARIRAMVGKELVWDKDLEREDGTVGGYRPVQYRDIVILLRTVSGWSDTFSSILTELGIPNFTGSQSGYFSAAEVRVVLSYLQVLDNPRQDIPLAAVLHSAIGGLDEEELAEIRSSFDSVTFYDCCISYLEQGGNAAVKEKLAAFWKTMEQFRNRAMYTPVHVLLWEILEETGYGEYAQSLPAGAQRKANLDMLVEKAIAYEATSYRGLYHFVRYIENLKKYEVDYGEANIGTEADNTVRIMSIHKSKGLEFPVVFVCGLAKQFNETDSRAKAVLHPTFGIGCDCVDTQLRTRQASILKKIIQKTTSMENLGEEMRVLYVAMTRAKEKLILTGCCTKLDDQIAKWNQTAQTPGAVLSYSARTGASCYLDWLMPALLRHPSSRTLLESAALTYEPFDQSVWTTSKKTKEDVDDGAFSASYRFYRMQEADLKQAGEQNAQSNAVRLQELLHPDLNRCCDAETKTYLDHVFSPAYQYRYESDAAIVGKVTVSELKKRSMEEEDTEAVMLISPEREEVVPQFYRQEETIQGAARGTLYHTFMESLDFSKKDDLRMQLEELVSCGKMTREETASIYLPDIARFLKTETGRAMAEADRAGRLHREQPFVLGVPASEIQEDWSPEETVLVQGIIDAWYLQEDEIVLVDYKTDRASCEELAARYRGQLNYYAKALSKLTGFRVKKQVLYSFFLKKEIFLAIEE